MEDNRTLAEQVDRLAKKIDGRVEFICPAYASVRRGCGCLVLLNGPSVDNWADRNEMIIENVNIHAHAPL